MTLSRTPALLKATGTLFCSLYIKPGTHGRRKPRKADQSADHFLPAPVFNCLALRTERTSLPICNLQQLSRHLFCFLHMQPSHQVTMILVSVSANHRNVDDRHLLQTWLITGTNVSQAAKWSTATRVTPQDFFKDTCGHFQLFHVDQNQLCLTASRTISIRERADQ